MPRSVTDWTLIAALAALAALAAVAWAYQRDMARAYQRIQGRSQRLASPLGTIEYTVRGLGPPVLVVHGSGGGFDQGEFLAEVAVGDGFRFVTPSRFGYLGSTFRPGAGFPDQADAFALLLDHLGLARVAVVAFSHGGPSALQFALRHPQRVSSLTLLSAGVTAGAEAAQQQASRKGDALVTVFSHDALYWLLTHALRDRFLALMGVDAEVAAGLDEAQRRLTEQLIDVMNPVAPRAAGAAFDNRAAMPDERIAAIRAPTLVVHARDDGLQLFRNAEAAQGLIPGARLLAYERGGHLVLAVQQTAVRQAVRAHLAAHPG